MAKSVDEYHEQAKAKLTVRQYSEVALGKADHGLTVGEYGAVRSRAPGRSAEFAAGHGDARPDLRVGQYSPPKSEWSEEALRTVEDERERRLRE